MKSEAIALTSIRALALFVGVAIIFFVMGPSVWGSYQGWHWKYEFDEYGIALFFIALMIYYLLPLLAIYLAALALLIWVTRGIARKRGRRPKVWVTICIAVYLASSSLFFLDEVLIFAALLISPLVPLWLLAMPNLRRDY